jgi:hypothetical protein
VDVLRAGSRGTHERLLAAAHALRARGELYERYLFHVEPNFSEDDVELEEAWFGADLGTGGPRLMFGRMKEPFSLEEMLPRRHIDFPGFSILDQFAPAEDHGVTLLGGSRDAPWEYGAAFYNGTGGEDLNSDKDIAARLVARRGPRAKARCSSACSSAGRRRGATRTPSSKAASSSPRPSALPHVRAGHRAPTAIACGSGSRRRGSAARLR